MPLAALRRVSLTRPLTQRIHRAVSRRARNLAPPLTIDRRHLYILPTPAGWFLAAILVVLLLGATHYSNSLAFALTFWLAAIVLVSMHRAHANVLHLVLTSVSAEPVFADQPLGWVLAFENRSRRARHALWIGWMHDDTQDIMHYFPGRKSSGRQHKTNHSHLAFIKQARVRRGRMTCPAVRIESRWPLGLFRVWTELHPISDVLVYPARRGNANLNPTGAHNKNGQSQSRCGSGEFIGHRSYVPGDSLRQIDWKVSARRDELLVRELAEYRAPRLVFSFETLNAPDTETRLSQLALWVDAAASAGLEYSLRLPNAEFGPASDAVHRQDCLKALALYG